LEIKQTHINFDSKISNNFQSTLHNPKKLLFMKQLIILSLFIISSIVSVAGQVIIIHPPIIHVGEDQSMSVFSSSILSSQKSSVQTSFSEAYYPVSAYVDEVALTVTFTESVGIANILVYDANNQLVDMVTIDTSSAYEAVLATDTWSSGSYKLVVSYGVTTLEGNFNF